MDKYEKIHMGCFLSDTYLNYAGASFVSLFEHTDAWITLHVQCVSENYPRKDSVLHKENRKRLIDFVRSYGHDIVFYELDTLASQELLEAVRKKEASENDGRFSGGGVATYGYLMMLELLPKDVKRYITFGADCMFNLDIRELQEMPLDDFGIASVSEKQATMNHMVEKDICKTNVVPGDRYFCCEIMVYDMEKVRARYDVTRDILLPGLELLTKHPEYNCVVQDIMNYYWAKDYQQLPVRYGVFTDGLRVTGKQELEPAIYHFAGRAVDVFATDDVYTRAFISYWCKSPFCDAKALMKAFALPEKVRSSTIQSVREIFPVLGERTLAYAGTAANEPAIAKLFGLRGGYLVLPIENQVVHIEDLCTEMKKGEKLYLLFFVGGYEIIRSMLIGQGFVENVDFADGCRLLTAEETGRRMSGRNVLLDEMHP